MRRAVAILGVPVDDLTTAQVLERIDEFVQTRQFHQIATANTDFLIKAQSDPELKSILRMADMVVPDGMPIVWASRLLRTRLPERVTGADLVPALAEQAARRGYRIFMLGGAPEVALKAKAVLEERYPGLQIVGCESPDIPNIATADHEELLERIEAARPDILLVAFGNPKQEKWIHMHRRRLRVPACIGVGGTFDFLAGNSKRAPKVMQRTGLEFLHRWRQDPKRLASRYRQNLASFPPLITQQIRWMMRGDRGRLPEIAQSRAGDCTVIAVRGALGLRGLVEFQRRANAGLEAATHLVLDFRATTRIDSAALGTLVNLKKRAAWIDRDVRLVGLNRRLKRILGLSGAEGFLAEYASVEEAVRTKRAAPFTICLATTGERTTAVLCGHATVEFSDVIFETLAEIPASIKSVALDLTEVFYIECAALAALYRFSESAKDSGREVRLIAGLAVRAALERERLVDCLGTAACIARPSEATLAL